MSLHGNRLMEVKVGQASRVRQGEMIIIEFGSTQTTQILLHWDWIRAEPSP